MSISLFSISKDFDLYIEGDPDKESLTFNQFRDLTDLFHSRIYPIVRQYSTNYYFTCNMYSSEDPEFHVLEYELAYKKWHKDHLFCADDIVKVKLDFIAIEAIISEIAKDYNLILD